MSFNSFKKVFFLFIAAIFTALLLGCGGTKTEKYYQNISELRSGLFAAESAHYKISAVSGVREEPYELNGVSNEKRDFTVITVVPSEFLPEAGYKYRAEIEGVSYEGDLLPHPFMQSLSADIPVAALNGFSFCVICNGEETFTVEKVITGELIDSEKALTIALDKLENELKRFKSKGKLKAEIYVRLTENPIDGSGGYFWYVAFVGENKDTVAVLLNGDTGAVAAVRK